MKYIFEVTMKAGFTVEEYAQGWLEASRIIQESAGAQGTYLHRKIGYPDTVLAIAHWQSKAHRDAKDDVRSEKVRAILARHARVVSVSVVGEFEDPEWQVLPNG